MTIPNLDCPSELLRCCGLIGRVGCCESAPFVCQHPFRSLSPLASVAFRFRSLDRIAGISSAVASSPLLGCCAHHFVLLRCHLCYAEPLHDLLVPLVSPCYVATALLPLRCRTAAVAALAWSCFACCPFAPASVARFTCDARRPCYGCCPNCPAATSLSNCCFPHA